MMVDYCKLNKAVATITAAFPDVLSLLEQISIDLGLWYAAIDLVTGSLLSLLLGRFRNSSHSHDREGIAACIYNFAPGLCQLFLLFITT